MNARHFFIRLAAFGLIIAGLTMQMDGFRAESRFNKSSQQNNGLKRVLASTPLPDLAILAMKIEFQYPTCFMVGDLVGVRIWIENKGDAISPSFVVQLNNEIQNSSELAVGENIALFFPGYENVSVTATVDPSNLILESNEDNNSVTAMLPIPTLTMPCTRSPTPTQTMTSTVTATMSSTMTQSTTPTVTATKSPTMTQSTTPTITATTTQSMTPTITPTPTTQIKTWSNTSLGLLDGDILESTEQSDKGGAKDNASSTFHLGDDASDKQYRTILSFNTASIPDNAIITKVTLKIRTQSLVGTNPFTILNGLKVDMRKPFFGSTAGLSISDFQAAVGKAGVATFGATPVSNWYSAILNLAGRNYINKTGTTQFRLRFSTDDNNDNAADYMKFFSGDYANTNVRPTLIIEYYVP